MCSSELCTHISLNQFSAICRSLRPLIIALLPGQQRSLNRLKAMREQLSLDVNNLINDFGPKLYEDFDQVHTGELL